MESWQLANAAFFAGNVLAVRSIPRLDASQNTMLMPLNYLTPAPYAFAIWGVIYLLEFCYSLWQLCQCPRRLGAESRRVTMLKRMSPFWCMANACQISWCFSFRSQFDSPGLLWISAVFLSGIAISLGLAHYEVISARRAKGSGYKSLDLQSAFFVYVPITLHFGWTTAAALVNWNGWMARCSVDLQWSAWPQTVFLYISLALAGLLGTGLSLRRKSELYAFTVAWAVFAVANRSRTSTQLRDAYPGGEDAVLFLSNVEWALGAWLVKAGLVAGFLRIRDRAQPALQKGGVQYVAQEPSDDIKN